jgi:hypothetical protein
MITDESTYFMNIGQVKVMFGVVMKQKGIAFSDPALTIEW